MANNVHAVRREFYLNADFDRTLRGVPSCLEEKNHGFFHEMSHHFLFAADPGESVILHRALPGEFLEYIAGMGFELPRMLLHPAYTPGSTFTPFGWNAHTEELNHRYAIPSPHPALEAVRRANSRVFSHGLERSRESERPEGDSDGGLFESLPSLEGYIRSHPRAAGWMAKGEHGHAGTANRRLSGASLSDEERRGLALLFAEDRWVALEPWHERLLDMSANFQVDADGGIRDFRGHELVNSRDGSFLGLKIAPSGQPPEPWRESLEQAAGQLGQALYRIGYFGPVSMDAYVRSTPEGPVLRPWVDINARQSMALPAHGLARRIPGRHLSWRWAKPRKLALPSDYSALRAKLGPAAYDPETRRGILAVSPLPSREAESSLSLEGGNRSDVTPKRVAFLLCGRDETDLAALQAAFQGALERKP